MSRRGGTSANYGGGPTEPRIRRGVAVSAVSVLLGELALLADAERVHQTDARERAGDRLERGEQVGLALAGDREPVDREAEQERAGHGAEERPDDPAPLAVGQEDREVPDREAHH